VLIWVVFRNFELSIKHVLTTGTIKSKGPKTGKEKRVFSLHDA